MASHSREWTLHLAKKKVPLKLFVGDADREPRDIEIPKDDKDQLLF